MTLETPDVSPPVLSATKARQGLRGGHIFWLLLISTALAVIGMIAAWVWQPSNHDNKANGPGQEQVSGDTFKAPTPVSPTPPDH